MAAELARALKAAPPEQAAEQLAQAAIAGLKQLGAGRIVPDMLAVVDALAESLQAVKAAFDGNPDDGRLSAAAARLAAVLGPKAPAAAAEDGGCCLSIEDAAALFIRLEPQDGPGWQRLENALERLAQEDHGRSARRVCLDQAVMLCRELTRGTARDPGACTAAIGALLDEAMNAVKMPLPAAVPSPSPAPGSGSASAPGAGSSDIRSDYMPANPDPDLLAAFITESSELIQNAEEALLSLEQDPQDMEAVGKVFRAFHTVKGTAGFLELTLITELGHHAETVLSRVRDGEIRYSGGYADLCLQALDAIKELVASVQQALAGAPLGKPEGYDTLLAVLKNPEAAGISEEQDDSRVPRVGDILVAQGGAERGQVEKALSEHPGERTGVALVKAQAASVAAVGRALRTQKQMHPGEAALDTSVRVSTQRLDRLIDMVGELVIAHSMVAQDGLVISGENHGLAKKVSHTSKIVRELQDISMSMRMVPLKATFNKMARLARDVGRKLGKNVNFLSDGEDTKIDRNLVDIVHDPLVHMVRNAVDHGIETSEERRAAGKPEPGTVKISAYHSAGSVVMEISDDGRGLDREVLLAKARQSGLVRENADLSDREVFNLVFEPGFSTARVVTDVSGRGVGMDVVKKNIELLRGTVEIKSEKGIGSVFKMSLPLTLAIIDGMVIRVGLETYVIPTLSIIRSVKPAVEDVFTVLRQGEMLRLQGHLIPLYRMARIYNIGGAREDIQEAIVVVVEDEQRQAGLVIDELVGRQQVVIKSLGRSMRNIPGISGGAIMPDGRVGLILDVGGLLRFATPECRDDCRQDSFGSKTQVQAA
jgi:two-component system chemotaxis sensor kinase CheA